MRPRGHSSWSQDRAGARRAHACEIREPPAAPQNRNCNGRVGTKDRHLRVYECFADFAVGNAFRCLMQRGLEALDRFAKAFGAEAERLMMDRHDEMSASVIGHLHGLFRSAVARMDATDSRDPNEQVRSMIGIVLVTHGRLAAEFRAALEHVVGPRKQIESIAIGPDDDIEQRRQDIVSAVTKVDSGAGVVVLTDMFGATPSNLAISIMNGSNIEVIAAVNLPMLIKLASVRETSSLEQAVIQA
jgi:mannose PTS system EIIA component